MHPGVGLTCKYIRQGAKIRIGKMKGRRQIKKSRVSRYHDEVTGKVVLLNFKQPSRGLKSG